MVLFRDLDSLFVKMVNLENSVQFEVTNAKDPDSLLICLQDITMTGI